MDHRVISLGKFDVFQDIVLKSRGPDIYCMPDSNVYCTVGPSA